MRARLSRRARALAGPDRRTRVRRGVALVALLAAVGALAALVGSWPVVAVVVLLLLAATAAAVLGSYSHTSARIERLAAAAAPGADDEDDHDAYPYGIGPEGEYAERCANGALRTFETFVMQSRSDDAREVLARAATRGRCGWDDLGTVLDLAADEMARPLREASTWRGDALCAVARVLVSRAEDPRHLRRALTSYDLVVRNEGRGTFVRADRFLYLEAAAAAGDESAWLRASRAARLNGAEPFHVATLRANAARGTDPATWLASVNQALRADGLEELVLDDDTTGTCAFDRLGTVAADPVVPDGPLVSVIVPTFQAGDRLLLALRGLLRQSWQRIEVIVVDDCSGPEADDALARAAAADPRVRVVVQDTNQGAYAARNRGLAEARGTYVTCHDDDDWSHPRKLERQVRHLEENPDVPACMSLHARTSDDLVFTRINNNPNHCQPNMSSLMFRRELSEGPVGRWQEVRKGADGEFKDRIEAVTGATVTVLPGSPLSFTRTRIGSLTSGEMSRGYIDPRRVHYLRAYQRAHARGQFGSVPLLPRPGAEVDLVLATDFRFPGGTSQLTLREARAAREAGWRVGLLQLDSPLIRPEVLRSERYWEELEAGTVPLTLRDPARTAGLLVRHPSVLHYADGLTGELEVQRAALVVNHPPMLDDGSWAPFDVPAAAAHARRLFGASTVVHAESGVTLEVLRRTCPDLLVSSEVWPGHVESSRIRAPRAPVPGRVPVVGRHSRDHPLKWPDRADDMTAAYRGEGTFRTTVLGGVDEMARRHGIEMAQGWEVHAFDAIAPADFLEGVDFWVYFHHRQLTESFGMAIVEAMAAGCVVVLPDYLETTFGEGAVYCTPREVRETVARLWQDPGAYRRQSAAGVRVATEAFSTTALLARIEALVGSPAGAGSEAAEAVRGSTR